MKRALAVLIIVGVSAGAVFGNTAYIRYASPGRYCGVAGFQVDVDNDGTWDRVQSNNVYTGEYKFRFDPNSPHSSETARQLLDDPFYAWCIDVDQNAPTQWHVYDLDDLELAPVSGWNMPMGTARADLIRELFGRFRGQVDTDEEGEAFAAALWEIVFEQSGTYDLYDGTLRMNGLDGNAGSIATGWLGQLDGSTSVIDYGVFALTNPTYQDFAITSPGYGENPVPEPVTVLGLVLGGAALTAYSRRREAKGRHAARP